MKFRQFIPKGEWPDEKTIERISLVDEDIKNFNRKMNKIDSQVNELMEMKRIIKVKVSNKNKYKKQLLRQLKNNWIEL